LYETIGPVMGVAIKRWNTRSPKFGLLGSEKGAAHLTEELKMV